MNDIKHANSFDDFLWVTSILIKEFIVLLLPLVTLVTKKT